MLDRDSLTQLRQLKQDIHQAQDRAEGYIKGTQGRFGFVVLDDGREVFLSPEQMLRVFPGDRVAVLVVPGDKGKPQAQLERLLESPLRDFTGRYHVKGNAHFVIPDLPQLSRWLFLPPKARGGAQAGDFVSARIRRHPFGDGRPQAQITARLGAPDAPRIAATYATARWQLPASASGCPTPPQLGAASRSDLTGLPLVTIDNTETRDMDDALYAESTAAGWRLWVAVADPLPWLEAEPGLEAGARERAATVYLPGQIHHMLPPELACDAASLHPEQERPALVCEIDIDRAGGLGAYRWHRAMIRSRARHDYHTLAQELAAGDADSGLQALAAAAEALRAGRREHQLVLPERPDYALELDENGRLREIRRQEKTDAHRIVEECMIVANRCAAQALGNLPALYVCHGGFRPERLGDVRALVQQYLPKLEGTDPATLDGYVAIMRAAGEARAERPLRAVLSRWLERGRLSREPAPHFGMGLATYTTATSPLRKYNDLLLHRLLTQQLRGETLQAPDSATLDAMQAQWDQGRRARQLAEQWLKVDWLHEQEQHQGPQRWHAEICQINSRGARVRLLDNGIEGTLDLSTSGKCRFDAKVLELEVAGERLQLEQTLEVSVGHLDRELHSVSFLRA